MPRKPNSSGLVLDGSSPRSRKKPWRSVGNQSRRWWRYEISVSLSTGSWQWRLTWVILYVAACINSANSAAVKRSLTLDSRRALATAFVASRIDYCNGVLYGVAKGEVQRLQMVLNSLLRDSSLVRGSSATSPLSSVMSSTGSLYSTESATESPYWLGTVFTASARPISVTFVLRWLQPLDKPTLRSATRGDFVIPRTRTKSGRTEFPYILTDGVELAPWFAQAFCYKPRTFSERTEKHTCLGKPTHQPLRTIEEWTYLLTYLLITLRNVTISCRITTYHVMMMLCWVTENRNTSTMRWFKMFSRWRHILFSKSQFNNPNPKPNPNPKLNPNNNPTPTLNLTLMKCLKFDSLLNTHFKTPKPA